MADGDISEAERLRLRRRQRILENKGARLDRIVADNKSVNLKDVKDDGDSTSTSVHSHFKDDEPDFGADSFEGLSDSFGLQSTSTRRSSAKTPKLGVQSDGSVIMPRIPHHAGRILLCVLAVFLSLLNAKQFAITFMSFEIAYYFLNGLPPYPPPNSILVALALVGLKESRVKLIKKCFHIVTCVSVDFSLFITFVMIPHIIKSVI